MLLLTASDVRKIYDIEAAFACVHEAALAHFRGETQIPARAALHAEQQGVESLVMPGVIKSSALGVKFWYVINGETNGLEHSSASIYLIEPASGTEVFLEGAIITDLRTGAMTGLAAQRLAPPSATVAGIIGAGIQSRTQAIALVHGVESLNEVKIYSRNAEKRLHFSEALHQELKQLFPKRRVQVRAVDSSETAVRDSHVVVAATTSKTPVIMRDWVQPGALICSVGSHAPEEAEIDPEIVAAAEFTVVDTKAGSLQGAGDIQQVIDAGKLSIHKVLELGQVFADESLLEQQSSDGIKVFKSVGFSAADLFSARYTAQKAVELGVGTYIDFQN